MAETNIPTSDRSQENGRKRPAMTTRKVHKKTTPIPQSRVGSIERDVGKLSAPRISKNREVVVGEKAVRPRIQYEDRVLAGVHHKTGRLATIREVLASDIPTRMSHDLSLNERVRLATRRIKENDRFVSMLMLGVSGVIDKRRALKEIKELSPVGLHLLDIDMRHARLQVEQSLAIRAKRRKRHGARNDGRN